MQVEIILDAHAKLGESPAWDAKTETLYWVDILGKRVHYHREEDDGFIQLEEMPGCIAPCKDGKLLIATRASFMTLDPATAKQTVLASVSEPANNRFNDGKCDPAGHFLAGTMDMGEKAASGALYSFDGTHITRLLDGIRISNGLTWSPDYKTFYFIDTPTCAVHAYDYDLHTGQIANPHTVITVPEALGWPDGMTSDTRGRLWIALWGGAAVTCWDPEAGKLLEHIPLPAKHVTSCAFGGEEMNKLYITSARKGLDMANLSVYRHSGSLMRVETKVRGMPTFEFG